MLVRWREKMENKVIISLDEYLRMREDYNDMVKEAQKYQRLIDRADRITKAQTEGMIDPFDPLCRQTRNWFEIKYDDLKELINDIKGTTDIEIKIRKE
jgi:hypothetical protein